MYVAPMDVVMTLRENLQEVEADTQEAFDKRRELVKLLVDRIVVSQKEEGRPKVNITYQFGPPLQRVPESVRMVYRTTSG